MLFTDVSATDRAAMAAAPNEFRFPEGETWKEVEARTVEALGEIAVRHVARNGL